MHNTIDRHTAGDAERGMRVLLYSHDTFGLGHLRRARALAGAITAAFPDASALIVTGSPVAGRFAFPRRVDHIRLPGVTKRADGTYVSQTLGMEIDEITGLRAGLIDAAIASFAPDLVIVDKEPTGLRGELMPSLERLRASGEARVVLGLRDVLDAPQTLVPEWERKGAVDAVERFYDEIWIYGQQAVYDPVAALPLSARMRSRIHWTGYLRREMRGSAAPPGQPYILVTPGGGGDGEALVDLVLRAYEADSTLGPDAALVYGPFLRGEARAAFEARVARLGGRVRSVGFESEIEPLFAGAQGVICMGGYNTFCEVLSFDKPAIMVPRRRPRLEQSIRAARAEEMGLVRVLDEERDGLTAEAMIAAIRALPRQAKPSAALPAGMLDGLDVVTRRVAALVGDRVRCAAE